MLAYFTLGLFKITTKLWMVWLMKCKVEKERIICIGHLLDCFNPFPGVSLSQGCKVCRLLNNGLVSEERTPDVVIIASICAALLGK